MKKNNYFAWFAVVGFAASLAIALPVFAAQTNGPTGWSGRWGGMMHGGAPGVFGTVTAVDGTTLTVTQKTRPNATSTTATTYTVDASNAEIYKGTATSTVSVSNIATGDMVMVQGTVNGTNVVATVIRDGVGMGMRGMPGKGMGHATSTAPVSPIKGNGEPVVGGNVTAVSGTTVTVTNASDVIYTIDASSATIVKNGTSTALSNVAIGDSVIVQGTVNGTSVNASSIIDQGAKLGNASSANPSSPNPKSNGGGFGFGIFGAIGGFFQHLFGF